MRSTCYISKFLGYFFILLCLEPLTVPTHCQSQSQRLWPTQSAIRSTSPLLMFNQIQSSLWNLKQEITSRSSGNSNSVPSETFLSTPEIICFHGRQVEEHKVRTADGYILSIFRIQKKPIQSTVVNREPVVIQHGLAGSSDDFLLQDPKDILPYLLADSGHNVWLTNIRGNSYGQEHSSNHISSNDPSFYDFSLDDGARDISDIIKYILKVEKVPRLSYISHSMGSTLISMAVSQEPGLNNVIRKSSFMAPGNYISHIRSRAVLRLFSFTPSSLLLYSEHFAGGRMIAETLGRALRKYTPQVCAREKTSHFCYTMISSLDGLNPGQIKNETFVKLSAHAPAATSMKLFIHYQQFWRSGTFQKYDYGMQKNLVIYGSASPPLYNLSRVVFPVQGFYGLGDNIIRPTDALRTLSELGNVVETIQVEDEKWTHFDFLLGKDARKLVYEKIAQFLAS